MARAIAILRALALAYRRDWTAFQSLAGNNFFLITIFLLGKAGTFVYLIFGLVLLFPLSTDPLRKVPPSRLALWPLERRELWLLRIASPWINPLTWGIAVLAVWGAGRTLSVGLVGLIASLFAAVFVVSALPLPSGNGLWRRMPAFPGPLNQLIRKNLTRNSFDTGFLLRVDPQPCGIRLSDFRAWPAPRGLTGHDGAGGRGDVQLRAMSFRPGRRRRTFALPAASGSRLAIAAGQGCRFPCGTDSAHASAGSARRTRRRDGGAGGGSCSGGGTTPRSDPVALQHGRGDRQRPGSNGGHCDDGLRNFLHHALVPAVWRQPSGAAPYIGTAANSNGSCRAHALWFHFAAEVFSARSRSTMPLISSLVCWWNSPLAFPAKPACTPRTR